MFYTIIYEIDVLNIKMKKLSKRQKKILEQKLFKTFFSLSLLFFSAYLILSFYNKNPSFVNLVLKSEPSETEIVEFKSIGFPISVDPLKKEINEDPRLASFINNNLAIETVNRKQKNLFDKFLVQISTWDLYQNLASPSSRTLVIYSGERKEEVAKNFSDILKWSYAEKENFLNLITETDPKISEGKFFPGHYTVTVKESPEKVSALINEQFSENILDNYSETLAQKVPLKDAIIIASLLEREAYDFSDMREISGIIWNRLFIDMPLQLDATLQYVKANNPYEPKWWPIVKPADKYLTSAFNTYQNKGLPPAPIANVSKEAVVAALNPSTTECLFYFHGKNKQFYCSKTYEEHVRKLRAVY